MEQCMQKVRVFLVLFAVLVFPFDAFAVDVPGQADTMSAAQEEGTSTPQKNDDGSGEKASPIDTYKINYFSINSWPDHDNAQVKFQFSVKYKFLDRDFSVQGRPLSLYIAYSQKSLWNVGQESMPFEESNYNPETFFDYGVNLEWGDFAMRNIILSPFEHESNGVAGPESRSWNRLYAAVRFGFWPRELLPDQNTAEKDHVELTLKVWHAYGYSDQDAYLRSLGIDRSFLDYEGHGEINIVLRDLIFQGSWGNRIDVTSKVGGKENIELQYQQKVPFLHFSPYIQYWYGYDETLLRFDRFGRRTFLGVAFVY